MHWLSLFWVSEVRKRSIMTYLRECTMHTKHPLWHGGWALPPAPADQGTDCSSVVNRALWGLFLPSQMV